eukprot:gnl/TRDRNA2_/TRDRNA2_42259_c0_seq1.p1 gnl/TRDRNA2_/TRDRNA2_42259_c0~~gnl/TRDRNA2_/TRDRNA2_42259_c0_seq1.p1  ORF type:complete len:359 (+),score=58.32 gnl/TRDRNA2_/TRDRNA2_42259_c0_seq1:47-1123(+)
MERRPWWLEDREDGEYCTLCRAYATAEHLAAPKHIAKASWEATPEGAAHASGQRVPPHWGDAKFFKWCLCDEGSPAAGEGWWRCILCNQWADEGHVAGQKHQKRARSPQDYMPQTATEAFEGDSGPAPGRLRPQTATEAFEGDSGPAPGRLRPQTATEAFEGSGAGTSSSHEVADATRSSAAASSSSHEVQPNTDVGSRASTAQSSRTATNFWKPVWSEEHQRHYYYSTMTKEVAWEVPEGATVAATATAPGRDNVRPGKAVAETATARSEGRALDKQDNARIGSIGTAVADTEARQADAEKAQEADANLPRWTGFVFGDWEEYLIPALQRSYYFNTATRTTQWERPPLPPVDARRSG